MRIIIYKEKKNPSSQYAKKSQTTKTAQPTANPALRANQVIQELGAGKEQKAPNSNRLTWESSY